MQVAPVFEQRAPLLVMAVGNILRQDDGFAEAVLDRLAELELPETVELFNAGTSAIEGPRLSSISMVNASS